MSKAKINVAIFIAIILVFAILNMVVPKDQEASASENRDIPLSPKFTIAKLLSGDFFQEYDNYVADTFIFRDKFIDSSRKIKELYGVKGEEAVQIYSTNGVNVADKIKTGSDTDEKADGDKGSANSSEKGETKEEELVQNQNFGQILMVKDSAMEVNTFNEAASKSYAASINFIEEQLSDDINVYSMLVPTQIEFTTKKAYKDLSYPQNESISFVNGQFNDHIIPVNVYDNLKAHANEYIYFRSDHHWTATGAYYAYQEFAKAIGDKPESLSKYDKVKIPDFLGSLYRATLSEKLSNNPDTITVYKQSTKHKYVVYKPAEKSIENVINMSFQHNKDQKYAVFMSGDYPLAKITTKGNKGKKLVVIKDSYANAFIPFLLPHFEEIYIVDPRMYEGNLIELIQDNNINNVLFLNYVLVNRYDGFSKLFKEIATN